MGDPRQRPDVQAQLIAFGRWLRTVRQFRDMTQEQLGERAGIERAIISRIERGELNPGIAYLWPLADALRVKVRDLFPDDDHPLLPPRE